MCRDTAYKLTDGCIRPKPRPTRDDVNQNHDIPRPTKPKQLDAVNEKAPLRPKEGQEFFESRAM